MDRFKRPAIYLGVILIIALTVYLSSGCGNSGDKEQGAGTGGKDFTEFATTTLDGKEVDQSIFSEYDVTMVNVWGAYCSPCIEEMPDIAAIYRERQGKAFNVIGLIVDVQNKDYSIKKDEADQARSIIKETGADYTHILLSRDINDGILRDYNVNSIPTTFFVDSSGKVIEGSPYVGSRSKQEWTAIIEGAADRR